MSANVAIVIGAKGGAGATTLCVDAVTRLSKNADVALVDGDLVARRAVAVLLDKVRALDAARATPNMASIDDGRLTIVELTATFDGGFTIKPTDVAAMAEDLSARKSIVIVDAPQPFAAAVRPFVTMGRRFVLIVEPSVLGLTSARVAQLEFERFGIAKERLDVVVVARDPRNALPRGRVESALGTKVSVEIPSLTDRRYERALEQFAELCATPSPSTENLKLSPSSQAPVGDRRLGPRRPPDQKVVPIAVPAKEGASPTAPRVANTVSHRFDALKTEIHDELAKRVDPTKMTRATNEQAKVAELRQQVGEIVAELLHGHSEIGSAEEAARLKLEIVDEAIGLGPLEDLLREPDISEIMVNGPDNVFVERRGRIERTAKQFTSDKHLRATIERIIAPLGRRLDEAQPMVDARLPDGSRVNAIIEPLSLNGATMTIRRFGTRRMTSDDLIQLGAAVPELLDFLRAAVEARLNIVVAGGTGSGKTTFLNVLSSYLPVHERIVTIEDAAELSLDQDHVVRLEARPPNIQGAGEIRIRDLVRNALRMRPDRIIVGECRGGEALDMLQAMNTGHDGSLTTIHANSPRDALSRLETLVLMAGFDLPVRAIREQVAGAVDMILQLNRMRDGSRKLTSVCEVVGLEGDVVTTQEIARFDQRGVDKDNKVRGNFVFTGVQPMCLTKFQEYGITYDVRGLSELERAASW
ncbi:MAG TPA: ATPase, T2SS/T4P/T4SS family [Candidatus Elarobacter sp.]|jgi:pilus assembly protein CpaF|nr:ATPase, T2SS/T4P/T4SS family [Candidatus Elarobacter sp.]